jgi:peptidoglycan/LPS O-acetylase OafA/YrhL
MTSERFHEIDILRGIAIFAMILIHVAVYFPSDHTARFLWDFSQFAVPFFLFCSFYIFFKKGHVVEKGQLIPYVFKRFKRLLVPYWIFLIIYIPLVRLYEPSRMSNLQIVRFITATTVSNDVSWLVTLFLMLTLVVPFVAYLGKKRRPLFYLYGGLALASSVFLLFYPSPLHFKLIMWLPWSVIIYFTYYFVKEEKNLFVLFVLAVFFYSLSWNTLSQTGQSFLQYDNKYPPNLFHLSYGMGMILIFYFLAKKKVFELFGLRQMISFLSVHSYSIFFIHFLILYVMTTYLKTIFLTMSWWEFFNVLFVATLASQYSLNQLRRSYKKG